MFNRTESSTTAATMAAVGDMKSPNLPKFQTIVFVLFILTLLLQGYTMFGARVIAHIDEAVKSRKDTFEMMARLEQQDADLLFTKSGKELAKKNLSYFQLRTRLDAIDSTQNDASTSLYQWNAVWAAPMAGVYGLVSGKRAADLWGADNPGNSLDPGRIHYGSEAIARTLLDVLQGLVLPTLYASLGGWVRLIRDRRRKVAASDSFAAIDVREPLMLGAIVGSVLGFFYTSDLLGAQVKSLPLMGLSFFAGYSIDWLFSHLDRLASGASGASARSDDRDTSRADAVTQVSFPAR